MHWADQVAEKLSETDRKQTIASGISISGHIHIGHSNDVFIADAVRQALEERGVEAKTIWYADDFDPMRRVPWPISGDEYMEYLGMPYVDIPSPDPEYETFVDFFKRPFVQSLDHFGVEVEVYSSAEVYRSGQLADQTRTALENSNRIRGILNQYRSNPLPEGWLPFDPICEKCGKMSTTRAYKWEGDYVYYKCEGTDYTDGCGHTGRANYTEGEGKLTWRVEWPARWKMLGVTCEPFGKDHATAGGSYDTGELIAEEVFDYDAPEPIPYEWISLRGEPMSSSKGKVFTLEQWLEIADPELLRYLIFRSKALKAKNFDPGLPLLELYQEYRQLEDVYFGKEEVGQERKKQEERIYELSQVGGIPDKYPQRIPFRLATVLIQVAQDADHAIEILIRKGVLEDPEDMEVELGKTRLKRAKNWVEKYAPDRERLEILEELSDRIKQELTSKQKKCLSSLAGDLSEGGYESVGIHNLVYETARKYDLKPKKLFQAIYKVLLGKKSGPRVGNFLTALEDEFVVERFRNATE